MEFIPDIIQKIPSTGDPHKALKLCLDVFMQKFNVRAIAIHAYEKESQGMYLLHAYPLLFGEQSIMDYEKTPAFFVARTLQPVHIPDIGQPGKYKLGHMSGIAGSISCYPLTVGKELVGVIYFNWSSREDVLSEHDRQFDTLLKLTTIIVHMLNLTFEDSETGLYNRSYFIRCIFNEILRSARNGHSLSLILLYMEDKGHIQAAGKLLKRKLRQTDHIGRVGPALLACLLPETDSIGSKVATERLKSYLKKEHLQNYTIRQITYPDDVISAEEMLQTLIEMEKEMTDE